MNSDNAKIVSDIVTLLETAWNSADGAGFARPFAEDADFVNIRGDHMRGRPVIAQGHQGIFDTIYKASAVQYEVAAVRPLAPTVLLAHVKATLKAPTGPLAGQHNSLFTMILILDQNEWRIAAFHNTLVAKSYPRERQVACRAWCDLGFEVYALRCFAQQLRARSRGFSHKLDHLCQPHVRGASGVQ